MFSARSFTYLPLVLSFSFLTACNSSSSGSKELSEPASCEVSGQSFGIVGGEVLGSGNELSASTVFVIHIGEDKKTGICTGTLIDDNKVLTAAHCISEFGAGKTVIAFTNNADCVVKAPTRTLRAVTRSAAHPEYSYNGSSYNANYDLAVLKIAGKIPDGYKVRSLPAKEFSLAAGDSLVMTGYGVTTEDGEDSGTLRFTTASQDRLMNQVYIKMSDKTLSFPKALILDQPNNGVCSGDSGGPLYAKTASGLTLIGITSMGIDHRSEKSSTPRACHGVALFTNVRDHINWLKTQMRYL